MRDILVSLLIGILFGLGLIVSIMVSPAKVLAFLDIAGDWDPSLLLVMVAALVVTGIGYQLVFRRQKPLLAERFRLPDSSRIDARLLAGAALFGVGWGMSGLCPGPAITALGAGRIELLWFFPALALGLLAARTLRRTA